MSASIAFDPASQPTMPRKPKRRPATPASAQSNSVIEVTDAQAWSELVAARPSHTIYVDWAWGAYKSHRDWTVRRVRIKNRSGLDAVAQVQSRRRLGVNQHYIEGGILPPQGAKLSHVTETVGNLIDYLALGSLDCVFIDRYHFAVDSVAMALLSQGFAPHLSAKPFTALVDLTNGAEAVDAALTGSWRNTLKHAQANPDLDATVLTHRSDRVAAAHALADMSKHRTHRKGLGAAFDTAAFCDALIDAPHYVMVAVTHGGTCIAVQVGGVQAGSLDVVFAAARPGADELAAHHLAVWTLVETGLAMGKARLDLGRIDPAADPSTFQFARGVACRFVQADPCFYYCSSPNVRSAMPFVMKRF